MSTIIRFKIIGCLKAQEEVLEIVKKKMEEVNSTNAPMPKVNYFVKNFIRPKNRYGNFHRTLVKIFFSLFLMENVMSKEIMRKWEVVLNNKWIIRSLATEQGSSLAKGVSN